MSYSDQKFYTQLPWAESPVGTATFGALASAGVGTVAAVLGGNATAFKAMSLQGGHLECLVAPGTSMQPCAVAIMDGTSTMGTAVVTTFTAGQKVNISLVAGAASTAAAADALTVNVYGTATASVAAGQNTGQYRLMPIFNEQFT